MTKVSRRILLLTFDVIGPRLGGSSIRVLGLARGLQASGHLPTIVTPELEDHDARETFPIRRFDLGHARETLLPFLEASDVAILPLHALKRLPFLRRVQIPLVFDIYDPVLFELKQSEQKEHLPLLNQVLRRGDFFLCASERQRDYWLGALSANGRISANELIEVVPFGIDPAPSPAPMVEGARKNIVWPGGIWDWTDPKTLLQAMQVLAKTSPQVQLTFFAGKHPGADHVETSASRLAHEMAGRNVHFVDDYIPFAQRGDFLAKSIAAVSTHRADLESHFAYRVRFLDCIWAGLPTVCTEGDVFSELVVRQELGLVVAPQNPEALAGAIARITGDTELATKCRRNIIRIRPQFDWNDAVKPLARFCSHPRVTHTASPLADASAQISSAQRVLKKHGAKETVRRLKQHLRNR